MILKIRLRWSRISITFSMTKKIRMMKVGKSKRILLRMIKFSRIKTKRYTSNSRSMDSKHYKASVILNKKETIRMCMEAKLRRRVSSMELTMKRRRFR
jgi:hypothetical protein